jgi:hypothetical protein
VLPRQAANVNPKRGRFNPANDPIIIPLRNYGVGTGQNDAYSLLAVSGNLPQGDRGGQMPTPDIRAVGINTFFVPPDFCSSQFLWVFAINSWERQSHLFPVIYDVVLDIDRDGTGDYSVFNADLDLASFADGRQVTWVQDLTTGEAQAFFFAEHATNTANTLLALCGEQIGLGAGDILSTNVDATVEAVDFYFGGAGDFVDGLTITPLGERFVGLVDDLAGNTAGEVEILDFGSTPGNTEELGILLFTNGDRGPGARGGATVASEALILGAKGADLSALRGDKEQP